MIIGMVLSRWGQKGGIITFVPDSKSWSKGICVRIYQIHIQYAQNRALKAISRLENHVLPPTLHNVELNSMLYCAHILSVKHQKLSLLSKKL